MTDTIQSISKQLSADVQSLNTISQNIANISTTAYRAQRLTPNFNSLLQSSEMATALDLREGAMVQTGNELDFALHGPGFFRAEQSGQTILVRSGKFRVDAEGRLSTEQGGLVLSDSGPIVLGKDKVQVNHKGEIWQANRLIGVLSIVNIPDVSGLKSVAGGYSYQGQAIAWEGSVRQGMLEQSNVDAADESIRLMELTRHIESVQRAISTYDKVLDIGINRIGDN